jgi:hypothetical protein
MMARQVSGSWSSIRVNVGNYESQLRELQKSTKVAAHE